MNEKKIVWNLPTRILHWLIALPVLTNFIIEGGEKAHKVVGYISIAALILRIIWGFMTKSEARFANFPLSLGEVKSFFQNKTKSYSGHNPVASWTYIFIWISVGFLGITGFMMGLDAYWGEEWLEEIHEILAKGLKVLILIHFIGIIIDSIKFKRKTWLGMITGLKY